MDKARYKWLMLGLLSLAFFFSQADRVLFGLLTIPIQEELGLSDIQIGLANTVFFVVFAFAVPLAGYAGDRFNRKWVITAALVFWSLMTVCTGLAGGLVGLVMFRSVLTPIGESFYCPSAYALIASHHRESRTLALAIHQSALYIGLMVCGALVAWTLKAVGGWRVVFWVFGAAGIALGVSFVWLLKDGRGKGESAIAAAPRGSFKDGCLAFVRCPTLLMNVFGFIAINFANNAYISWAPKFAARKFGLSVGEAGNSTMLYHHICCFAAVMVAGFVTDRFIRRGFPRFRLALQAGAMALGAPALVCLGFAPSVAACFAATMAYGLCRGAYEANLQTSAFDVVRPENRSTVVAVADLAGMLVGSISPLVIGALSDRYGIRGFEVGFSAMGGAYLLGAAAMAYAALFTFKKDRIDDGSSSRATVAVFEKAFRTYPFSDPDPVPATSERRYPYFRYDKSADSPEERTWKTVVLENGRISVTVLPEIGGKVWGAYDKIAKRDFIYSNHVMKFRDIAMRGPWLSGGIEFNFGIIGHSPSTSTPVDWLVRENGDGSVSCFVASEEYITRTRWQVEIRLGADADEFETRTVWYNGSGLPAPYYHWMNAAYSLKDDPEFLFPGDVVVGHEGEIVTRTWPLDAKGRDISVYSNNAYGGPKSYHLVGGNNGFYGIWWRGTGYGSCHRSLPYAKYGRKIWLWALSREGGIWEDLLTDSDGQYAELQSGRGFNQPRWDNVYSPFKNPTFVPGTAEVFTDRWGPIRSRDEVAADEKAPPQVVRPVESPAALDFAAPSALAMLGIQALRERDDDLAHERLSAAVKADPTLASAWNGLAELAFRRGRYAQVHDHARRALALDLYDREANFLDGAAYFAEGDMATARDRLGVAAFSGGWRGAAFALIARSYVKEGEMVRAVEAADEALRCEALQQDALLVKAIALRGSREQEDFIDNALGRLPLFHALRYERDGIDAMRKFVRNELPGQTFLELGSWYEETGLPLDAMAFFRQALPDPEAEVRLAFLEKRTPILDAPVSGVFPFRRESLPALASAADSAAGWKAKYLLAVLKGFFRDVAEASALLESCGDSPDEAPFYLYRARYRTGARRIADIRRAQALDDSWRAGRDLAAAFEEDGNVVEMLSAAKTALDRFPGINPLQIAYARALTKLGHYRDCMAFLEGVKILPSEHRDSATEIWHECQKALGIPLTWPENLGRGEPYHDGEWRQKG